MGSAYRAFISYSHSDAVFARWLHARLETYRLPGDVARLAPAGEPKRRLGPIFRDREELPASEDLSASVRAALAASDVLVVLCSPDARASPWVRREIELFRELGPDRPILAAIVRGEPAEAFPDALLDGREPLAADLRKQGDGRRLGFLKVVAGIAGVPLDSLVQRDAQRNLRRVTAVTLVTASAAILMAVMSVIAIQSRNEAERQRGEAEGLVEYMLTDLREKLRGVGRLDVMEGVNARAMAYCSSQGGPSQPPDESLLWCARTLHAMGEDDDAAGRGAAALASFREAHRMTAMLLARRPDDTDRIFAHAQSEYWVGYAAWQTENVARARPHFEQYARLAQRLIAADPRNKDWLLEAAYAESNLGTLALQGEKQPELALARFTRSLAHFEAARKLAPGDTQMLRNLADVHGWLADSARGLGDFGRAYDERLKERGMLDRLVSADPKNAKLQREIVGSSVGLARLEGLLERPADALAHMRSAKATIDELARLDPQDEAIAHQQATVTVRLASLLRNSPQQGDRALISAALRHCASADVEGWSADQKHLCDDLRARGT